MSVADAGSLAFEKKCNDTPAQLLTVNDLRMFGGNSVGISAVMDLAVSDTHLYVAVNYSEGGALLRVPIRGGQPELIATISGMEQHTRGRWPSFGRSS